MANYPAPPQHRMAYDRDGTVGLLSTSSWGSVLRDLTATELQDLNDEGGDSVFVGLGGESAGVCLIFPELRDLDAAWGYVTATPNAGGVVVDVSTDTTNGVDGTWTTIPDFIQNASLGESGSRTSMREDITSQTSLGIRAVRLNAAPPPGGAVTISTMHLYGEPSPGENPDRLEVWDATLDQRAVPAVFDFGDAPRASSLDKTFRVKNLSTTKTAVDIRVAMETLSEASPSFVGQHTLSTDGSTFLAQVSIGDLAPGAISGVITLRQALATNAALSLWWMRVFASPDHWL